MVFSNRNPDAINTANAKTIVVFIFFTLSNSLNETIRVPHGMGGYLKITNNLYLFNFKFNAFLSHLCYPVCNLFYLGQYLS